MRLPEPGMRATILEQWEAADEHDHHRVSREFLALGTVLRGLIDRMGEDGSMEQELEIAIDGLKAAPFDDSVAEGPHARWKKFQCHSKAATFEWMAATMRLRQNMCDYRDMWAAIDFDLDEAWCSYKNITKLQCRRSEKLARMKCKSFTNWV